jgi:hypothetical protein
MQHIQNKKSLHIFLAVFLAASSLMAVVFTQHAHAAALSQVFVRFDRMKTSTGTTGTVCAKPASAATEAKVMVTFPTGFTLGAFGTFTVSTTNISWPTGGTAWLGITAPASAGDISGQNVTFASSDLTAGTLYCFNWTSTSAVTQPSSANTSEIGSVTTQTSAPATIDTAQYATTTVGTPDDTVVVTATVPPLFSFALSSNSDALGTLTAGTVKPSPTPVTATVNTNAKSGWSLWAKDTNTGMTSSTASYTIASTTPGTNSTLSGAAEGYNMGVTVTQTSGSQTPAATTAFVGGSLGKGGGLNTTLAAIVNSTGTANNAVVTMTNNLNVIGSTPAAADYTDTIYVVGAGLF